MGSIQPMSAFPLPNIMPKPTSQNSGVPMQKSIRFFIRMFPAFFARVNPASHMANPACIKKAKAAPKSTQMVLTALYDIFFSSFILVHAECAIYIKERVPARHFAGSDTLAYKILPTAPRAGMRPLRLRRRGHPRWRAPPAIGPCAHRPQQTAFAQRGAFRRGFAPRRAA